MSDERRPAAAARWVLPSLIAVAVAGLGISAMLTSFHLSQGKSPWALFRLACGAGGGCEEVLASPWAVLPGGIPLAGLGAVYFGGLALWYLVVGPANRAGRRWQALPLLLNAAGVLGSLFFLFVMLTAVHAVCVWCALSHLLNFALLWLSWKLWPRSEPEPGGETPRPPWRLGVAGVLLLIAAAGLVFQRLALVQMRTMTEQANQYAQAFYDDLDVQRHLVLRGPAVKIPVRPDDPVRGNPAAAHTAVVFSDLQCPACRTFAAAFESQVLPMAGDRLKIVYKHYPLNRACNPWLSRDVHPHACEAAEVAEAAREEGGNDAFWRAHDALFRDQETLADQPVFAFAAAAGIDAARFAAGAGKAARHDRILEDVALGHKLGVDHTPTVYFDGHPLQTWNRIELWKALALTP
jgi:protein-disulfide isomerase/uncharacterized membrane protein